MDSFILNCHGCRDIKDNKKSNYTKLTNDKLYYITYTEYGLFNNLYLIEFLIFIIKNNDMKIKQIIKNYTNFHKKLNLLKQKYKTTQQNKTKQNNFKKTYRNRNINENSDENINRNIDRNMDGNIDGNIDRNIDGNIDRNINGNMDGDIDKKIKKKEKYYLTYKFLNIVFSYFFNYIKNEINYKIDDDKININNIDKIYNNLLTKILQIIKSKDYNNIYILVFYYQLYLILYKALQLYILEYKSNNNFVGNFFDYCIEKINELLHINLKKEEIYEIKSKIVNNEKFFKKDGNYTFKTKFATKYDIILKYLSYKKYPKDKINVINNKIIFINVSIFELIQLFTSLNFKIYNKNQRSNKISLPIIMLSTINNELLKYDELTELQNQLSIFDSDYFNNIKHINFKNKKITQLKFNSIKDTKVYFDLDLSYNYLDVNKTTKINIYWIYFFYYYLINKKNKSYNKSDNDKFHEILNIFSSSNTNNEFINNFVININKIILQKKKFMINSFNDYVNDFLEKNTINESIYIHIICCMYPCNNINYLLHEQAMNETNNENSMSINKYISENKPKPKLESKPKLEPKPKLEFKPKLESKPKLEPKLESKLEYKSKKSIIINTKSIDNTNVYKKNINSYKIIKDKEFKIFIVNI